MNSILKIAGALIVLIGVLLLAIYYFGVQTNGMLIAGGLTMVIGLIVHIVLNKKIQE